MLREFEGRVVASCAISSGRSCGSTAALAAHDAFRDPDRVAEAEQLLERALRTSAPPPGPSAAFTRAGFEVGASNQLAVRAADAIVAVPGSRYNPLFIHGPSGVGKTHLLNAIGNGLSKRRRRRGGAVACVPAQLFVDELIAALQEGTVDRWRARYRAANALLLDDVQFVAGKERTQEELFHVFNALYADGKQLVFASDRPPRELVGSRGAAALALRGRARGADAVARSRAARAAVSRDSSRTSASSRRGEMLSYLAERQVASVREIIGTANRIAASAEVAGVPVTIGFIRAELEPDQTRASRAAAMRVGRRPVLPRREKIVWDWPDAAGAADRGAALDGDPRKPQGGQPPRRACSSSRWGRRPAA